MKFNPKININFKVKSVNVSATLSILLILVLLFELYLAYNRIYSTLFTQDQPDIEANVVRVNLQQYNKTLDYLKSFQTFEAKNPTLPRANIFR